MHSSMPGFPSFTISWSLLKLMSLESVMPSSHLILCDPLLLLPSIFPSITVFSNESVLHIRWPRYWSFSFSISPSNEWIFRTDFLYDWPLWSPSSPRDSQESSPTPQFKSISYSAFSLLYGPTLTSIHDYWKNHSFGYIDLCWQSNLCFLICCLSLSTIWTHFRWSVSWVIVHAIHFDI